MKSEWKFVGVFSQFQQFTAYLPVGSVNYPLDFEECDKN
jgi:hypothetical protein